MLGKCENEVQEKAVWTRLVGGLHSLLRASHAAINWSVLCTLYIFPEDIEDLEYPFIFKSVKCP